MPRTMFYLWLHQINFSPFEFDFCYLVTELNWTVVDDDEFIIWNLMNLFRLKDFVWIEANDIPSVSAYWIDETKLNLIEI